MVERRMIEDENVRERGADEVDDQAKNPVSRNDYNTACGCAEGSCRGCSPRY